MRSPILVGKRGDGGGAEAAAPAEPDIEPDGIGPMSRVGKLIVKRAQIGEQSSLGVGRFGYAFEIDGKALPVQGRKREMLNLVDASPVDTDEPGSARPRFAAMQAGEASQVAVCGSGGQPVRDVDVTEQPTVQPSPFQFRSGDRRVGACTRVSIAV